MKITRQRLKEIILEEMNTLDIDDEEGNAPSNHNQNQKNDGSIQFTCLFEARFHKQRQIIDTGIDIGIDIEPKHWVLTLKLALIRG